ncbi:monocarboxylate transporter 14-like [Clytia hemisphaerica]|uniref:Uncharacterized protein n=1 Tax=Clytia hemisphaerica TaxID=252671 RepID=A0A7M5WM90_9CNID
MKRLKEVKAEESNNTPTMKFSDSKKQTQIMITENKTSEVIITALEDDKQPKTHPDGGWGWVVVAAAFLTQWIVVGLQNSSGVIFNELVKKYNESRGSTGFVSSISCGMMFILGPLTTSLCQRFGCRLIAALGGFLCVLGMVLSAHAPTLNIMYLTFGVTWGLGTSFCYFPTLIILVPYFNKKLALVNGIVSAGAGVGTLILSPSIQWFAGRYGVKYMFYCLGALHGLVLIAAALYRPLPQKYLERQGYVIKPKNEEIEKAFSNERQLTKETLLSRDSRNQLDKRRLPIEDTTEEEPFFEESFDSTNGMSDTKQVLIDLFTDKAFVAWCCGLAIFMLGYFVPFVHIVRYAKLIGIKEVDAAFLISVLSIVATIFKVLSGKLAGVKRIETLKLYQMALLVMGVATTLIPVQQSYFGLIIYAVIFGMSESCFIVMIPLITKDIVGVQRLPLAIGCVFMLMGIPTVVGAPIAGWIYDAFQDYSYAFYVAGMMNICGVLIMFFITYFKQEGHLREKVLEERRKYREDKERQEAASRTIVMTSFASTERIYLSNRDLLNPYEEAARKRIPTVSRVIEFTSFASSERIYLSSRDLLNPFPSNNNMERLRVNTLDRVLPTAKSHDIIDGFTSLPHPRSSSDGARAKRPESTSFAEQYKLEGTGYKPRNRPLSLQLTPSSHYHPELYFPMPKTLESIQKTVIHEEPEPDSFEQLPEPCDQHPDSPTLARFADHHHHHKQCADSLNTSTTRTPRKSFLVVFWSRLWKSSGSKSRSVSTVRMENEILVVEERLAVV